MRCDCIVRDDLIRRCDALGVLRAGRDGTSASTPRLGQSRNDRRFCAGSTEWAAVIAFVGGVLAGGKRVVRVGDGD